MAAAQAAAEAALYETTSQEMERHEYYGQQQYMQQQQQQQHGYAGQQERGYLETLRQNPDQSGMHANLLQNVLGSSSSVKDHSTDELLQILAQQHQGQQHSMEGSYDPDESMSMRPDEHYMTIAQDGKRSFKVDYILEWIWLCRYLMKLLYYSYYFYFLLLP